MQSQKTNIKGDNHKVMTMTLVRKAAQANLILTSQAIERHKKPASTQQGGEAGFHLRSLHRQIYLLKLIALIRQLGRSKDIHIISLILR